jgi:hypothetical protein
MYSTTPLFLPRSSVSSVTCSRSPEARLKQAARALVAIGKLGVGIVANDFLLGRDQFFGERELEFRQAAAFQQFGCRR